jgi:hypothetical protein
MPLKIHPSDTRSRPAVGRISCLADLGMRPIQDEPVHHVEYVTKQYILNWYARWTTSYRNGAPFKLY